MSPINSLVHNRRAKCLTQITYNVMFNLSSKNAWSDTIFAAYFPVARPTTISQTNKQLKIINKRGSTYIIKYVFGMPDV